MSRRVWKGARMVALEREESLRSHSPTRSHSHASTLARPHALTLFAVLLFAVSAWQANRQVCPGCSLSDVSIALPGGTSIYGRLYLPTTTAATAAPLPAVVVCHGYLANLAFMEIPWAADLTRLGLAVLFLDRRGHGRSGGTLWPRAEVSQKLDDLEPDIGAAIAYLRAQQPLIDPNRIGLLGHSDGATAAIIAASADWDVRATVAVSASVGPWQLVNHVAPQNLMLVYGAEDHFIVNDTDSALIARGTRGYLDAPGQLGDIADGTGRRLVRIAGQGHVDVVFSDSARPEILQWLRQSLLGNAIETRCGNGGCLVPSPHRWWWVGVGVAAILLVLITASAPRHHRAAAPRAAPLRPWMRSATLVLAWIAGLVLAPWFVRHGRGLAPGHEGSVLIGVLFGPTTSLTVLGMILLGVRQAARAFTRPASRRGGPQRAWGRMDGYRLAAHIGLAASSASRGVLAGMGLFIASYLLLLHHYEIGLSLSRLTLLLFFATAALPAFTILELWLWWVARDNQWHSAGALALLAAGTAVLSGQLFERMSVAPGYLLSAALLLLAAYRIGRRHTCSPIASVVLGATTIGWFGANVCALY